MSDFSGLLIARVSTFVKRKYSKRKQDLDQVLLVSLVAVDCTSRLLERLVLPVYVTWSGLVQRVRWVLWQPLPQLVLQ